MKEEITLDKLELNSIGIIEKIDCEGIIKRRLLDLGLVKGTKIKPVLKSPSGDPRAFEFRGSLIAIRKEQTKKIYCKTV